MTTAEALRAADRAELPDLRNSYIEASVAAWGGEKPPCCAIGGAALMSGVMMEFSADNRLVVNEDKFFRPLTSDWQAVGNMKVTCPACLPSTYPRAWQGVGDAAIAHLYDVHGWSRTEIADWLDSDCSLSRMKGASNDRRDVPD